jgi:hypothetical protein
MRNQSGSKLVSDKNGVLFADPKRFWISRKMLLSVIECNGISDIRKIEIHTAGPLVADPDSIEV